MASGGRGPPDEVAREVRDHAPSDVGDLVGFDLHFARCSTPFPTPAPCFRRTETVAHLVATHRASLRRIAHPCDI